MAQPVDRLTQLTAREKALAIKARARHRYTFDMPLELFEALIEQAEVWDQPLPDVVRACIRRGLEHVKQFGGAEYNPYAYGKINGPKQSDIDPTGYDLPAQPHSLSQWVRPTWDAIPHSVPGLSSTPTPPTRFAPVKPVPGLMPSGATPMMSPNDSEPSRPPYVPEDEPSDLG
jgi:hypothetical protein